LEARVADVVDLDDELELLVEAAGGADDGHGSSSLRARSRQLGLEGPRVLADAEDDELGGLVRGEPTRAMSLPAKLTVGVLSVSETSPKNAMSGSRLRKAPLFICVSRNAVMVRRTWARRPSVLFLCRANWRPCLSERSMKLTPRRSAT